MAFGIYVHIPYCLQRCSYCDFSTYEFSEIPPPEEYVELVKKEIRLRSSFIPEKTVDTIYFGGGTPSLIDAQHIVAIIEELAKQGFEIRPTAEITIEINPATVDTEKLKTYIQNGVNRFSVGAQSFNDDLLSKAGRKHSSQDTINTLELLKNNNLNYSFDLLFALPQQTLSMLKLDLEMVKKFSPNHLSAYCLTVPENHPMQKGRVPENEQIKMFSEIEDQLSEINLNLYEISNFAKPEFESKHNNLYWTDESYWGIGLSAHSYMRDPDWGMRFWSPSTFNSYAKSLNDSFAERNFEKLKKHQSLTDYCHTFLRLTKGISLTALEKKFGADSLESVLSLAEKNISNGLLSHKENRLFLSQKGRLISNAVFENFVFTPEL